MNIRKVDFTAPHKAPPIKPAVLYVTPVTYKGTLSAPELQKMLGCSRTKAYSLITETRQRFPDEHRTIPPGYVSEKTFMGQLYRAAPRKENR